MDEFCAIVLERTLEMATEYLPAGPNSGVLESINTVRSSLSRLAVEANPTEMQILRRALARLMIVARQQHQYYVAARFAAVLREIGGSGSL